MRDLTSGPDGTGRAHVAARAAPAAVEDPPAAGDPAGGTPSGAGHWVDTLIRNTSDLIAVIDTQARLLYANSAARRILGYSPTDQAGIDMFELIHPDDVAVAAESFAADLASPGVHPPGAYRFRTAQGDWRVLEVVATNCLDDPVIAGVVINARDVTERANLTRALNTLSQGNQVLVRATDERALLVDTCRVIVESGGYALAWVGFAEDVAERTVRAAASWGRTEYLDGIRVTWAEEPAGQGPVGTAIRSGSVQVVHDAEGSHAFHPWQARATSFGLRSVCALPLGPADRPLGALAIYSSEPGTFSAEAVGLLQGLADNLSYGLSRIADAHALEASEARFRTLASAAPIGIVEVSSSGIVEYANARAAEIAGRSTDALKERGWLQTVHPEDAPALMELAAHPRPDRRVVSMGFRVQRPDGEVRHVRLYGTPKGPDRTSGYVATLEDVTEEVRARESLLHQAFYDTLTGLPNRALLLDRLHQELAPRRRGVPDIAVLFLDVDRLKLVNDSLGHEVGDAVLCEIARRLEAAIRSGETVARFSGDEFVFILRDVRATEDATSVARRVLDLLQAPIHHAGHDLYLTASIGIVLPDAKADPKTVVRDADTAMYEAKWSGGNRYVVFDDGLHRRSMDRLTLEGELRQALHRGEFEMYYQPIVETSSNRPVAAEALIRWRHPLRGLVGPAGFVPVAEESGLIKPIGRWVLEASAAQLAAWDAGLDAPKLQVLSINLSARQLEDDDSYEAARRLLAEHRGVTGRIALEITESTAMSESAANRAALDRLRHLGLRLAIDDFGTGYSSLAYLHSLPITSVKIDQSFVERLGTEEDSAPVVRAIIEMSHAMGLMVVAEGVSDDARRRLVTEMGCDFAQGFHWTPPLPAPAFAEWWRAAVGGERG